MVHPQLPLGLAAAHNARFESFYAGENRELVSSIEACAEGRGETLIYVTGSRGSGKSHLLQAACHHATECRHSALYLPVQQLLVLSPEIFDALEQMDLICLDDADALAGHADWEQALFALFNRLRDAASSLLVSAKKLPEQAGFGLPDLASRLGWGVTYALKPLDDPGRMSALVFRAHSRGLFLPEETARFLLHRFPRDLNSLFDLLDRLDQASLAAQRRLTIPFVKSVLDGPAEPGTPAG